MTRRVIGGPTDRELEILQVLWRLGRCSVRDVHDALLESEEVSFTTVQTMLQVMFDKGLVERELVRRAYWYWPAESQAETQTTLVRSLMERAFGGSAKALVSRALDSRRSTPAELDEIQKLLDAAREAQDD